VAACVLTMAACTGGGHPQAGPSPSKAPPEKVTSLTATPVNAGEIDLQWVSSGDSTFYTLKRDGTFLTSVEGTSYKDTAVKPKKTYTYEVDITDPTGNDTPGANASATTPKPPPLSKARLWGTYGIRFVFTSEDFTNRHTGNKFSEKWKLKPKCKKGACSTVLVRALPTSKPGTLTLKNGTYHGSVTDELVKCQGTRVQETVTYTLHATRAKYLHGEWTVTTLSGTASTYSPPAGACTSSSSKSSLAGKRL
jgi:hypothetical protein